MQRITFSWNLLMDCNYTCPYCWFHGRWQDLDKSNNYLPVQTMMKYWDNIYYRYGGVMINMLGGEPSKYPDFIELLAQLSKHHTIGVSSNLSFEVDELIAKADAAHVGIRPTFHPIFADFDSFLKKAVKLEKAHFGHLVTYLAYPPQIDDIEKYRNKFSEAGLEMKVHSFWGNYNNKHYPESYTESERRLIEPSIDTRGGEAFQLVPKVVRGRMCRAGERYALIEVDGTVRKCGQHSREETMGNFFSDEFRLLDGPQNCTVELCPSNEWAELVVSDESQEGSKL